MTSSLAYTDRQCSKFSSTWQFWPCKWSKMINEDYFLKKRVQRLSEVNSHVQQLISFFFCITCSWWPLTSYYVFCTFLWNSLCLDLSCWQSKQASSLFLSPLLMTSYLFSPFHTCSLLFTPLLTNDSFTLWLKLNDIPTKKTYLKCDSYPRVPLIPKMKILRVNMQRLFLIKEMQWLDS